MAACMCEACGGRPAFLAAQERQLQEKRAAFEAWYADPANAEVIARIKAEAEADRAKVLTPA